MGNDRTREQEAALTRQAHVVSCQHEETAAKHAAPRALYADKNQHTLAKDVLGAPPIWRTWMHHTPIRSSAGLNAVAVPLMLH